MNPNLSRFPLARMAPVPRCSVCLEWGFSERFLFFCADTADLCVCNLLVCFEAFMFPVCLYVRQFGVLAFTFLPQVLSFIAI